MLPEGSGNVQGEFWPVFRHLWLGTSRTFWTASRAPPEISCTPIVLLPNLDIEKHGNAGKLRKGQQPKSDENAEALSLLTESGVFLSHLRWW
jgi:hypothetical protein